VVFLSFTGVALHTFILLIFNDAVHIGFVLNNTLPESNVFLVAGLCDGKKNPSSKKCIIWELKGLLMLIFRWSLLASLF
jgi:hypothetical protein